MKPFSIRGDACLQRRGPEPTRVAFRIVAGLALPLVAWTGIGASAAQSQERPEGPGALQGRVLDSATGEGLGSADVLLSRRPTDASGRPLPDSGPGLATVSTDDSGDYRFTGLAPGWYRLTVDRPGYRTREIDVAVAVGSQPRVSVTLDVAPIELTPIDVRVAGRSRVEDGAGRLVTAGRVAVEQIRQERYLTTDARLLTAADVEESATLGEPDIFRALQRLPGVSTRDDFSAELWTRGGDWGQTRVYLDAMPLFNPVHGFGVLSGVSNRQVASATIHPGVRPVSQPEGSVAVVDLQSRSGRGLPETQGGVDVSLATAQAWAAGPLGSNGGWTFGFRRSWADAVARALSSNASDQVPYAFWDAHAGVTLPVADGHRLDVGVLLERDNVTGEIPDVLHRTSAAWGNALVTAQMEGPLMEGLRYRQRVGATFYHASVDSVESQLDSLFNAPSEAPADHSVSYVTLAGEVVPDGDRETWRVGYDLVRQAARYVGPETWPYSQEPFDLADVESGATLFRAGIWGSRRLDLTSRLALDAGLRLAGGGRVADGRVEVLPSLLLQYRPLESVRLAAGVGRYAQYAQSPAPVGPRVETVLQTGRRWVLAGPSQPTARSTIGTVGAEVWLGDGWLAAATAYRREGEGVVLPDPTPGLLVQRSPLVVGSVRADGVDMSVRRLVGPLTGSVAYSVSRARATAVGRVFSAPTDRTHVVDLSALTALGRGFRVTGAFTYASGSPFTRTHITDDGALLDAPFQRRGPSYASLDLGVDMTHRFASWSLGWFIQARNLLGRDNAISYQSSDRSCPGELLVTDPCASGEAPLVHDSFVTGIPTIPLLGFRVSF